MSFIFLTYFTFSEFGFVSLDLFDLKSADPDHTNADHARLDQDPKTFVHYVGIIMDNSSVYSVYTVPLYDWQSECDFVRFLAK